MKKLINLEVDIKKIEPKSNHLIKSINDTTWKRFKMLSVYFEKSIADTFKMLVDHYYSTKGDK